MNNSYVSVNNESHKLIFSHNLRYCIVSEPYKSSLHDIKNSTYFRNFNHRYCLYENTVAFNKDSTVLVVYDKSRLYFYYLETLEKRTLETVDCVLNVFITTDNKTILFQNKTIYVYSSNLEYIGKYAHDFHDVSELYFTTFKMFFTEKTANDDNIRRVMYCDFTSLPPKKIKSGEDGILAHELSDNSLFTCSKDKKLETEKFHKILTFKHRYEISSTRVIYNTAGRRISDSLNCDYLIKDMLSGKSLTINRDLLYNDRNSYPIFCYKAYKPLIYDNLCFDIHGFIWNKRKVVMLIREKSNSKLSYLFKNLWIIAKIVSSYISPF